MNKFQNIYIQLLMAVTKMRINGIEKTIKAMVRLTSKNYLQEGGEYIKILFDDNSFLLALRNEEEFYYAESIVGHIKDIQDSDIGNKDIITYRGKDYKLGNKDDYQYVVELLLGSPLDIEGECRFSDYFPADETKEFLSLGWLSETGERADMNPIYIELENVGLV